MSVAAAASLLSPSEIAEIAQLRVDAVATAIAEPWVAVELVLWRLDEPGTPLPLPPVTVARRWANRQALAIGSEAAAATRVDGEFRAYGPWDVETGDTFVLADGPGTIVGRTTGKDDTVVIAQYRVDQGAP